MLKKQEKKYFNNQNNAKKNSFQDQKRILGKRLSFAASEAYKLLRTNLMFSMADEGKCKVIGVTSALQGEGKSTTSINTAYTLAETGKKVLLIEGDMRLPVAAKLLQLKTEFGLSHVLAGICEPKDAISVSVALKNLNVLAAGEIPPNPSELLTSERMKSLITGLSEIYDYIIIDLPPITVVSDGLAISDLLSGMIIVVRQDYCDQRSLAETMRQMEFLNVKVLGFVMNCSEVSKKSYKKYGKGYGYGYGYSYSYSQKYKEMLDKVESNSNN